MDKFDGRRILGLILTGTLVMALVMHTEAAQNPNEEPEVRDNGVCVQTYVPPGEVRAHEIYWTKGVTPPKMSNDPEKYGTEGYFDKSIEPSMPNLSQYLFTYEYDEAKQQFIDRGFYDINKTNHAGGDQKPLCYMATTVNMLHWWLKQNEDYITEYRAGIGTDFLQEDGLYDISQDELWEDLMAPAELTVTSITEKTPYYMQSIPHDRVSNPYLYPVYKRYRSGGWMDNVAGFFFNGYDPGEPPPNGDGTPTSIPKPEQFVPSVKGGFFHPVFGKTPLAVRHRTTSYSFYNAHLKQWLLDGKAVGISFYPTKVGSHAITIWGAEYDSSGNLCRIFITDSDDETRVQLDETGTTAIKQVNGIPVVRTLCSYDVYADKDGEMFLSTSYGDNAYEMDGAVVLSLGTEYWEQAMADRRNQTLTPAAPIITKQPVGQSYAIGATASLINVEASVSERDLAANAYVTYQWFRTESPDQEGTPISGQTHAGFQPPVGSKPQTAYYYCEVTSHKYGHHAAVRSDVVAIETTNEKLVNALRPTVTSISPKTITVKQGAEAFATISARSNDGGKLYYQWFPTIGNEANLVISDIPVAERSESQVFRVPTKTLGETRYYCKVINVNEKATGTRENGYMDIKFYITVNVEARSPEERCTISFSTPGAAEIAPITLAYGESVQEPIAPTRAGYRFTGWYEDGKKIEFPYVAAGDATLTAGWQQMGPRGLEYRIDSVTVPDGKIPSGNFSVQITVTNLASDREDRLVVAAYDNKGKMISLSSQALNAETANAGEKLTAQVPVTNPGSVSAIKAYMIPGEGELTPLSNARSAR